MKKADIIKVLEAGGSVHRTETGREGKRSITLDIYALDKDGNYAGHLSDRNFGDVFGSMKLEKVVQDGVEQPQGTLPCTGAKGTDWSFHAKYIIQDPEYMCGNCGGGFSREEIVVDEELDADLCTQCHPG